VDVSDSIEITPGSRWAVQQSVVVVVVVGIEWRTESGFSCYSRVCATALLRAAAAGGGGTVA